MCFFLCTLLSLLLRPTSNLPYCIIHRMPAKCQGRYKTPTISFIFNFSSPYCLYNGQISSKYSFISFIFTSLLFYTIKYTFIHILLFHITFKFALVSFKYMNKNKINFSYFGALECC